MRQEGAKVYRGFVPILETACACEGDDLLDMFVPKLRRRRLPQFD
jgi:hypothetical protein